MSGKGLGIWTTSGESANLAIPAGNDNLGRLKACGHDGLLAPVHAISLIQKIPLGIGISFLQLICIKLFGNQSAAPKNCSKYHFLQDNVIGVHDQVKPLLQPGELITVSHARSAAVMPHDLTHANAEIHVRIETPLQKY